MRTGGRPLRPAVLALVATFLAAPSVPGARQRAPEGASSVVVDGERSRVRWVDGDTFRWTEGPRAGTSARLDGFNTLESYGPVHRWGDWRGEELLAVAREATAIAAAGEWRCTARGGLDRYRRVLVSCPELAARLVGSGHAMVFAVGRRADPGLLALQHDAQRRRAGMWAKGVPARLLSSVHSRGERGEGPAYDRVVDTRTGETRPRPHDRVYATCEEVCTGEGGDRACMVYVPFERRYRGRPRCLDSEPSGERHPVGDRGEGGLR